MSGALADLLRGALVSRRHGIESVSGEQLSSDLLLGSAGNVQHALAGQDVAPHEPVHVVMGNRPSDLGALLGVWQAGAVVVPIHVTAAPSTVEPCTAFHGRDLPSMANASTLSPT